MIQIRSVKKRSKIRMKIRSMYMCSSLQGFQRVPLHVRSPSFIASRPRDLRNCSAIFVTALRSSGPRSLHFRARLLAMGFSSLRPISLIAAHECIDRNWVQHEPYELTFKQVKYANHKAYEIHICEHNAKVTEQKNQENLMFI